MIKTVAVVGEIYSANLGDYAIYESARLMLERKGYKVVPIDLSLRLGWSGSESSKKIKKRPTWASWVVSKLGMVRKLKTLMIWRKQAGDYRRVWRDLIYECDAVIIGGGQLLTDNMLYFPPRLRMISEIAGEQRKPIAVFGCGVGKDLGWITKRMHRQIFNRCSHVSVRDRLSAERISSFSPGTKVHVSPDLAYALPDRALKGRIPNKKLCGINIISIDVLRNSVPELRRLSFEQYNRFWLNIAVGVKASGMELVVMTNGNVRDYEQSLLVYDFLQENNLNSSIYDRPDRPQLLFDQIATLDRMISSRMHAGIISFAFGRPVATLAWDDKVSAVWEHIGVESAAIEARLILSHDPWIEIAEVLENTDSLLNEIPAVKKEIYTSLGVCLDALESQTRML